MIVYIFIIALIVLILHFKLQWNVNIFKNDKKILYREKIERKAAFFIIILAILLIISLMFKCGLNCN